MWLFPCSRPLRRIVGLSVFLAAALLAPAAEVSAGIEFDAVRLFPLGEYGGAQFIEIADFNDDGINDVVAAADNSGVLNVLLGIGDGTFGERLETEVWYSSRSMAVSDFNGDGFPDAVLANDGGYPEGQIQVLLGNGDGTFYGFELYPSAPTPYDIAAADLDNDGDVDLVVLDRYGDQLMAHLNDGSGVFGEGLNTLVGETPWALEPGDFNGDGKVDLAVVHDTSEDLRIFFGTGDGQFTAGPVYPFADDTMSDLAAGDFDGDGHPDLVISAFDGEPDLRILLGDGSGGFTLYQQYDIHEAARYVELCHLNDDQLVDIAVTAGGAAVAMLGHGDGTFRQEIVSENVGYGIQYLAAGDLDHDGFADLALGGSSAGLNVALNRGDGSMRTCRRFEVYDHLRWMEPLDLDADGDQDILMTHDRRAHEVGALINDGQGNFAWAEVYTGGEEASNAELADIDGDGVADMALVLRNYMDDLWFVGILHGQEGGTFSLGESYVHPEPIRDVFLWTVDGDAHLDMVTYCTDGIRIFAGNGDGSFGSGTIVYVGSSPTQVAGADLDGDGAIDMVVQNYWGDYTHVIFGDGSGGFSEPVEYWGRDWGSLNLGDLNQDGAPDLVYTDYGYPFDSIMVRLNDGSGAFLDQTVWMGDQDVYACRLEDVDGDGLLDALTDNGSSFSVRPGTGDGGFGEAFSFACSEGVSILPVAGDYDGDGDLDLAVGHGGVFDSTVSVYDSIAALGNLFAAGPGRGENNPSRVRLFAVADPIQRVAEWQAYGVDRYGVNVALGELNGSAGPELLTGAGPGAVFGPHVRGFDDEGIPLPGVSFLAYGTNKYGVNVTCGDLDGDGYDEIVTGAGPGAVFGPHVRGWNWDGAGTPTSIPGISYYAYGTPKWGVNVSCGDIDGDGYDEIVTGAGPGAVYGPHVRGWNCDGGGAQSIPGVSFLAYGTNKYGVNVACGDIDGDGIDEVVTGAGPGAVFGPHVRGWNWDGSGSTQPIPGISFFAYSYTQWGANVSCGDLDGDGIDEILTGPGPGPAHVPRVKGWNYDGAALTAMDQIDFYGFAPGEVTHGVKPAGWRASRR